MSNEEEDWLNVGKSFIQKNNQKENVELIAIQQTSEIKQDEKKKIKKEKKLKNNFQIQIKLSEAEVDAHYDNKLEQQQLIDTSKNFIYKHEMGKDCLSIQLLPIGDYDILAYGHLQQNIPHYNKIQDMKIIGIKNQQIVNNIFQNQLFKQENREIEYQRYTEVKLNEIKSYIIKPISKLNSEDFIPFNNQLIDIEPISQEQQLLKRNQELQNMLQQDVNNLEAWKELLQIQEQIAEVQGYNQPVLLANRRLSILQKLEQTSELLADHPWVLAYKIYIMQNLKLLNDDLNKSIEDSFQELFSKYIHIQPIWILFLDHKLKSDKFSATMLRMEASKNIIYLQQLINETTRAQMIQLFKKIYIELIQQICFYEYEMGFKERSIGILQALCELNIFAPKNLQRTYDLQLKVTEFKDYWDYNLKTGEQIQFGWIEKPNLNQEFIGYFEQTINTIIEENPIKQFLHFQTINRWRPANQQFDKEWIEQNIDAVVIYEDIESYLFIFNDKESKLNLISALIQQLGFPSLNFYTLPIIQDISSTQLCYERIKLNYFDQEIFIKYSMLFQMDLQNNLSKFIYIKRLLCKTYEMIPDQHLLQYIFILFGILYLKNNLKAPNNELQQELNSGFKEMKKILKDNQNNLSLWILYYQFENLKKQSPQTQILDQITLFAKTKKQQMMILYTKFGLDNHDNKIQIIKQALTVYNDNISTSESTLILKLRNIYKLTNNKFTNLETLNKYKKELKPFQLSKRSILFIFLSYLQQNNIIENLQILIDESNQLKRMHFSDQNQKNLILTKYFNETSIILINLLKFSQDKEEICKTALQIDRNQVIFLITYIEIISRKFLYFQKLEDLRKQFSFQSPQICWVAYVLLQDPNKNQFLIEYLKHQAGKTLSQIYTEGNDQENFEGFINLKYNYILELILLNLQKNINGNVKEMYKTLTRNPYSINMYSKIIEELKESNEALNLLSDLQEKELKFI